MMPTGDLIMNKSKILRSITKIIWKLTSYFVYTFSQSLRFFPSKSGYNWFLVYSFYLLFIALQLFSTAILSSPCISVLGSAIFVDYCLATFSRNHSFASNSEVFFAHYRVLNPF